MSEFAPTFSGASADRSAGGLVRLGVLAVAIFVLTRDVNGWYLWNSALHCHLARNHVEYGIGYTKLWNTWGETAEPPDPPQRYLNHPPLLSAMLAVVMRVFGDDEWVGRTVPIACTMGSVLLLMTMVGRLHSPAAGALTGLWYALLPITAFYGRMVDHVPVVQFFSLLLLHGYVHWRGGYGPASQPRRGMGYYVVGVAVGIGVGWATLIMVGLVWLRHVAFGRSEQHFLRRMAVLTLVPSAALAAVVVHIAWGAQWDWGLFGPLLRTRTLDGSTDDVVRWGPWLIRQWGFAVRNFTVVGVVGVGVYAVMRVVLRSSAAAVQWREWIVMPRLSGVEVMLWLHGALFVAVFRHQSWTHDYWQYFLAPGVAVGLAAVVLAVREVVRASAPRFATAAVAGLLLLPAPFFSIALDRLHEQQQVSPHYFEAFKRLSTRVPHRAPVLTSRRWPVYSETFDHYINRWPLPQIAFYANRPLIHETDLDAIAANRAGCAAYLLEMDDAPETYRLARELMQRYETETVGRHHLIAYLERPLPSARP